jgi:hypothetical protein
VARSSVIIGIVMMLFWIVPLFGTMLALIGLTIAIASYKPPDQRLAKAGIFLNSLGLVLSLTLVSVSLYLFLSGAIDPQLFLEY